MPETTVRAKITFSNPLKDLYMLKELLRLGDKPEDFDCIKTKIIKRTAITN